MLRKPLALAAAVFAVALQAPSAHAAIVPGQVIDGPSSAIQHFNDLDIAPDGTGALVYTKHVGIVDDIWVSTFNGTTWSVPEDLTTTSSCNCGQARVAAGNGGRVVVTYVDATATLRASLKPSSATVFGPPVSAAPGSAGEVQGDDVDMDPVSGVAYAVIDQAGAHVRATRLSGTTWTEVNGAGANLDGLTTDDVGATTAGEQNTARVAVDSSGNAVVAWPAVDASMNHHVFARRIAGTVAAASDVQMSVPSLAGHAADGLNTDNVVIDGGGSANPWVAFREQFTYPAGHVRDVAAQLSGNSATPAQPLDGLPLDNPSEGAEFPQLDVNSAGQGLAAMPRQLSFQVFGSQLAGGMWSTGFRVDSGTPTLAAFPSAAIADTGNGLVAWHDSGGSTPQISAREDVGGVLGAPFVISKAGAGGLLSAPDAPIVASSSAAGTVAIGFGQTNGGVNSIVAAVVDLPQPPPVGGGNPPPPPPVKSGRAAIKGKHVFTVRGRFVTIPLACKGSTTCKGTITLRTAKRKHRVKLGSAKYSIAAGHTKRVRVRLSKKGSKLIRKGHSLKALATVGGKSTTVTLKRKR